MSTEKESTPLPFWQMTIVTVVHLCEAMELNVLFPFMAFMVEDFGYTGSQLGLYVGILASSFGFGQICSALIWGKLSDTYGRKPIVIFGTVAPGVAILIFGSSKCLTQAIIGRFLSGFLSGNLGVLKCVLTESTDETNRVEGFGVISLAWFSGCIISPLVGGILSGLPTTYSHEGDAFSSFYFSLISYYPFLLPCIFCATCNFLAAILSMFCMTETRWQSLGEQAAASKAEELRTLLPSPVVTGLEPVPLERVTSGSMFQELKRANSLMHPKYTFDVPTTPSATTSPRPSPSKAVCGNYGSNDETNGLLATFAAEIEMGEKKSPTTNSNGVAILNQTELDEPVNQLVEKKGRNTWEMLSDNTILLVCANYGVLLCAAIFMDETIPLFLKQRHREGGFEFSMSSIGLLLSFTGVISLIFCIYILPSFNQYNKQHLFFYSALILIPCVMVWPSSAYLYYHHHVDNNVEDDSSFFVWSMMGLLALTNVVRNCFVAVTFTIVMIQVNNSVDMHELGVVNGLGQLVASVSRCVGPVLGGMLWSVSTSYHFLFLNFIIIAVLIGVSIVLNGMLPASLEVAKDERPKE